MGLPGFLKKLFGKGDEGSAPPSAAAPAPVAPGTIDPMSASPTVAAPAPIETPQPTVEKTA